jgi:L-threonylcarbamoyladenylate synthase
MNNIPYVDLEQAQNLLKNGELLAIPTETVYGLAANIHNAQAVENIFKLKGRPTNHPLIIHVAPNFDIEQYVKINELAQILIQHFWPGPLSLVLPKTMHVSYQITGGQDTVAIRCPKHTLTQKLLQNLNFGVAAPSANRFGYISPTQAQHVYDEYLHHDMQNINLAILDGGACAIGLESTIVQVHDNHHISILRYGMIYKQQLDNLLNIHNACIIPNVKSDLSESNIEKIRVSGDMKSHYAPHTPLKIQSKQQLYNLDLVDLKQTFILCFEQTAAYLLNQYKIFNIRILNADIENYAQNLYADLRYADIYCEAHGLKFIYIEDTLHTQEWQAIADRLMRATALK